MSAVIRASMNHLSNAMVADDTAAMLAFLDATEMARPGAVGCVGHCMSGRYITTVAARFPHRIKAAASLYGVGIVTEEEDSPHKLPGDVRGELYYAFAEHDQSVPEHVIPALKAALEKTGTRNTLEVYPGTHHGFCFPERQVYDAHAAESTWAKIFALWDRNVKYAE
jgi:carboxymethylenebutenolidase